MENGNGVKKYQFSIFDNNGGQYVMRTDDAEEFKKLVTQAKLAAGTAFKAPQTQNSAPTASERPKVPYMQAGDKCHVCGLGKLQKTQKESKSGEKYNALVCDQTGCRGFAYISKFPKFKSNATMDNKSGGQGYPETGGHVEDIQVNFGDDESVPF